MSGGEVSGQSVFCYTKFMKKILYFGVLPLILLMVVLYCLSMYTHTGRVWSMYAFASFKAPFAVKQECIKETNQKVYDKFLQPLDFNTEAKDALREYWHFSYYRACMFTAGYDFWGDEIEPSSLVSEAGETYYRNPFAKVSFVVLPETNIIVDNAINPDLDDYIVATTLQIGEADVMVRMDRSNKLQSVNELSEAFAGFDSQKDFKSKDLEPVVSGVTDALAFRDGAYYGYAVLIPDHHIVSIFGDNSAQSLIDQIVSTIEVLE
jgi:hypothetical protein